MGALEESAALHADPVVDHHVRAHDHVGPDPAVHADLGRGVLEMRGQLLGVKNVDFRG